MFLFVYGNTLGTVGYGVQRPYRALNTDKTHSDNWINSLNNNLWGNPDYTRSYPLSELKKTIYDPCPPGYIVPPVNAFILLKDKTRLQFVTNGFILRGDYGQTSFYPYSGRVFQRFWDAFGHNPTDISAALWTSDVTTYNTSVYDGGSSVYFEVRKASMQLNHGDFRARGIPVRCVKQQ